MKTRIISGTVGIIIFILVLLLSMKFSFILSLCLAALCAVAIYEMLNNTGLVKSKPVTYTACAFGAVFVSMPVIANILNLNFISLVLCLYFIYFFVTVVLTLVIYKNINTAGLFAALLVPLALSFAFFSIYFLFTLNYTKLLYFFLIFIFAWGADTGAYFTGTFIGKHKLAAEISPKKTIEGSVGGIITAVLLTALLGFLYNSSLDVAVNIIELCICAAVFSVFGMIGDLITSFIKRDCGIKDYGKIMPGHGGVLDRFDSVLFIAPFYLITILFLG